MEETYDEQKEEYYHNVICKNCGETGFDIPFGVTVKKFKDKICEECGCKINGKALKEDENGMV